MNQVIGERFWAEPVVSNLTQKTYQGDKYAHNRRRQRRRGI